MTEQEAYDRIRKRFSAAGAELGMDDKHGCCYRGGGDPSSECRCAVGCLIPDELYHPSIEDLAVDAMVAVLIENHPEKGAALAAEFDGILPFLSAVQTAHDRSVNAADFVFQLDGIARRHGLEVPA